MGYYMRFVSSDDREITLPAIAKALKTSDASCELKLDQAVSRPIANLLFGGETYAEIEINSRGDGLFDEEIGELKEFLEDAISGDKEKVLRVLESAKRIVAVRVFFDERAIEDTLSTIDPLWEWLFKNRIGLLQVDGEGYYDSSGLILKQK